MHAESGFFTSPSKIDATGSQDAYHDFRLISTSTSGLCQVMKARRHGRTFIVKTLKATYRGNHVAEAILRKEFEAGTMIDSPYIVRTIDFLCFPEYGNAIILEYCPGITLREYLESHGEIDSTDIDFIVQDVAAAICDMHAAGLIHRDLKPENIIISTTTKSLKIIDLGFADSDEFYILRDPAGTKRYTPADRTHPDSKADSHNDIYSFGIILSELSSHASTGRRGSLNRLSRQLTSGKISSPDQILPAYRRMINKAKLRRKLLWILPGAMLMGVGIFLLSIPYKSVPEDSHPITDIAVNAHPSDSLKIPAMADSQPKITDIQEKEESPKAEDAPAPSINRQSAVYKKAELLELIPDIRPSDDEFIPNKYGVTLAEAKYLAIFRRNEHDFYAVNRTDFWFTEAMVIAGSDAPLERRQRYYERLLSEQEIAHEVMAQFRAKYPGADTVRAKGIISQRYKWLRSSTTLPSRPE